MSTIQCNGMLKTVEIQAYLSKAQKCYHAKKHTESWDPIAVTFWTQIQTGFETLDDQLLASTCLFTVLPLTTNQLEYLRNTEIIFKNNFENDDAQRQYCTLSLMYGMFQSSFLTHFMFEQDVKSTVEELLKRAFQVLTSMAYDYSKFTFISFKTISSFKKVIGTEFEKHLFGVDKTILLLNLVNHNWENPITGVRDLNRTIFGTVLNTLDIFSYETVLKEIDQFNWNKAKYLMLSEIIEVKQIIDPAWVDGLIHSLYKPGLVSAGADMYYAILKHLRSDSNWCNFFLKDIKRVLTGSSLKAIENFSNYWCLATFKIFPELLEILLNELKCEAKINEQILYSLFCIKKQGNKLGILEKNFEDEIFKNQLIIGLESCNVQIRCLAFDIICVSKYVTYPSRIEYELVTSFLYNNINSDASVLRQNMLNSLKFFLYRTHSAFLNNHKSDHEIDKDLLEFSNNMQKVLVKSLTIQGNYQRKITAIKLVGLLFQEFSSLCSKKKQQKVFDCYLLEVLKSKGLWILSDVQFVMNLTYLLQDPSDDVRESVMQVLLQYHLDFVSAPDFFNTLVQDGLKHLRSKFFYEINCGQSLFKLLLNILLEEKQPSYKFISIEAVFDFATSELIIEYELKRDVLKSIEEGKQINSFISIMSLVIELCIKNKRKLADRSDKIRKILEIMDAVSVQFASEDEGYSNADFSKISDIIEHTIVTSGYSAKDSSDETQISGLHQIVLNCMWLNVKECCTLASLLVRYHSEDEHEATCVSCLKIITKVLETSRHKGAIEAAGAALGTAIQYLTSLPEGTKLSKLPLNLLQDKLDLLISDASRMASITRRGAGLSILVHKIVSCDTRKGKPLFHYFMRTLLLTCRALAAATPVHRGEIDNEKDLPQAIYTHFLTRIIIDSSLASDMMFYSASLAELAFSNLTSKYWQIRNAALQLYGALIPKLIGQNKQAGLEDGTIATVAFDEFRTHSPKLWEYIKQQLFTKKVTGDIISHSDMVPILNLLASCAIRYNFSTDVGNEATDDLFLNLMHFLSSPIYVVRKLTAKCIYNIYNFETVYEELARLDYEVTENKLHGCLLLTDLYWKQYVRNGFNKEKYDKMEKKFRALMNHKPHSYMCKSVFENMFHSGDIGQVKQANSVLKKCNEPNVHDWLNQRIMRCFRDCSMTDVATILQVVLQENSFEEHLTLVLVKLVSEQASTDCLNQIVEILLKKAESAESYLIWKILYEISLKQDIKTDMGRKYLVMNDYRVSYKTRYILPFAVKASHALSDVELFQVTVAVLYLSDPDNADCEMRYIAAITNNHLADQYNILNESAKINIIKSAVLLLQDEDENVRNTSVNLLKNTSFKIQPFLCLNRILSRDYLHGIIKLTESGIGILCSELHELLQSFSKCKSDELNPFSSNTKNIYLEIDYIQQIVDQLT